MARHWLLTNGTRVFAYSYEAAKDDALAQDSTAGSETIVQEVGEDAADGHRVLALYWNRANASVPLCEAQRALAFAAERFGYSPFTLLVMCERTERNEKRLSSLYACALLRWLPTQIQSNCKRCLIVHPGARTRAKIGALVLFGLLPTDVYEKIACIERIEMLRDYITNRTVSNATTASIEEHDALLEQMPLADYGISAPTATDLGGEVNGLPRAMAG